jgi:Cu(I)/Ag(I) efflux system membrane fusion protein
MKNIIKKIKDNFKWSIILLSVGILLGWIFFHPSGQDSISLSEEHTESEHTVESNSIWSCSMHPQIKQDKPGKCPICAMDLVPLSNLQSDQQDIHPDEIQMTESAAKLADIQSIIVRKGIPKKELFLQGKVQPDERRISQLTARFGGRIEKLFVSFTGENVKKGQKLATIYSPELVTAQRELLEAIGNKDNRPTMYKAARSKLKLWDLTEEQIDAIEEKEEPTLYFEVLSPISGTVTQRHVSLGDYLKEGTALFEVIDLTQVWIMFDAYESDLPWIRMGDNVKYSMQSIPGKSFTGEVTYIDPFINPRTRVAKVRVQQKNSSLMLKPEMFVNGLIESRTAKNSNVILIPKSSILWTGKRAVVYVRVPERDQPSFLYKEIDLGPESGNFYVVLSGLNEGEEIAVNGVFKIDAAAQLAGKPSMMNPTGGATSLAHDHGRAKLENQEIEEDHSQHGTYKNVVSVEKVSVVFQAQLGDLYVNYLTLKNALVESDPTKAIDASKYMIGGLENIDMTLLDGDGHELWMKNQTEIKKALTSIQHSDNLESQRKAFVSLSDILYESIKSFGIDDSKTIYYQYCPMAIDNQGAFWLSEVEEINNPYFGEMMLRCGETREIIQENPDL